MTHTRKSQLWLSVLLVILFVAYPAETQAVGRRRGGGGGGGGGGAHFGGGGGVSPGRFGSRPPTSMPNFNQRMPVPHQPVNINRPQTGGNFNRPSFQPNQFPNGGLTPSNRFPTTANRPGSNGNRPQWPNGNFPSVGVPRPGTGGPNAGNQPNFNNRPNGNNRPGSGNRPTTRPTPGNVGDFIGMDRPVRPTPQRPSRPGGQRPGDNNRPGSGNRIPDRGGSNVANRPNLGNHWNNNGVISNRPGWANIDKGTSVNINQRWNNVVTRPARPGWGQRPNDRLNYWQGWGNGVRNSWQYYHHHNAWFSGNWWNTHYCPMGGWHYYYWPNNYPLAYWWTATAWPKLLGWMVWTNTATAWQQPIYYDYGFGGNVTYENNYVYIGGTRVATANEFAQSAMNLATVAPPPSDQVAAQAEWMPLGTFAVSTNQRDTSPSLIVQLAVNRDGIVSGTLYNTQTDQTQAVQGQVDKETQRVAMRIGESENVVIETGLYNLTQDEAPVLFHYGPDRTENYLLVRLDAPDDSGNQ